MRMEGVYPRPGGGNGAEVRPVFNSERAGLPGVGPAPEAILRNSPSAPSPPPAPTSLHGAGIFIGGEEPPPSCSRPPSPRPSPSRGEGEGAAARPLSP